MAGWCHEGDFWEGHTWQEAIRHFLEDDWAKDLYAPYQVMSEQPSEDGQSGIMYIKGYTLPNYFVLIKKVKATPIEDD